MDLYMRGRAMGKTTHLIDRFLREPNTVIVVANSVRVDSLMNQILYRRGGTAVDTQRLKSRVLTISEAYTRLRGRRDVVVLIDELEDVLETLFSAHVAEATLTLTGRIDSASWKQKI